MDYESILEPLPALKAAPASHPEFIPIKQLNI